MERFSIETEKEKEKVRRSESKQSRLSRLSQEILADTLINTKREIALPLFLDFKYPEQFRTTEEIGKGGSATIFKGELLDANMKRQHNLDCVAVKFIEGNLFLFFLFYFSFFFLFSFSFCFCFNWTNLLFFFFFFFCYTK